MDKQDKHTAPCKSIHAPGNFSSFNTSQPGIKTCCTEHANNIENVKKDFYFEAINKRAKKKKNLQCATPEVSTL